MLLRSRIVYRIGVRRPVESASVAGHAGVASAFEHRHQRWPSVLWPGHRQASSATFCNCPGSFLRSYSSSAGRRANAYLHERPHPCGSSRCWISQAFVGLSPCRRTGIRFVRHLVRTKGNGPGGFPKPGPSHRPAFGVEVANVKKVRWCGSPAPDRGGSPARAAAKWRSRPTMTASLSDRRCRSWKKWARPTRYGRSLRRAEPRRLLPEWSDRDRVGKQVVHDATGRNFLPQRTGEETSTPKSYRLHLPCGTPGMP